MAVPVQRWDVSQYLDTPDDIAAYLNAAAAVDDPCILQAALGDVAKAKGMTQIAQLAGVGRESLYKPLSSIGNPSWNTVAQVLAALGLTFEIKPTIAQDPHHVTPKSPQG